MATFTFQKPDKVIMIDSTDFEGKFEFRPLEPGYGLTVGNALRRVLLASLEGFAFTSVKIDNVVFRMGLSKSRRGARQLVSHEHIQVNGKICNIASRTIKVGDVVGVREKSKSLSIIEDSLSTNESVYEWITWDNNKMEGVFNNIPTREQITENIKEQLIVELYSK